MVKGNSEMIKAGKSDEEFLRRVQGLEKKIKIKNYGEEKNYH